MNYTEEQQLTINYWMGQARACLIQARNAKPESGDTLVATLVEFNLLQLNKAGFPTTLEIFNAWLKSQTNPVKSATLLELLELERISYLPHAKAQLRAARELGPLMVGEVSFVPAMMADYYLQKAGAAPESIGSNTAEMKSLGAYYLDA